MSTKLVLELKTVHMEVNHLKAWVSLSNVRTLAQAPMTSVFSLGLQVNCESRTQSDHVGLC